MCVCVWESHESESPRPSLCDLTPPDLDNTQHPTCLTATGHTLTPLPTTIQPSHLTRDDLGERHARGVGVSEARKVRRSVPSVGMKLRGPGSSGNAELADRSRQHSRKKEGGAMVVIATRRQNLWKFLEKQKRGEKKGVSGCC